MEKIKPCPIDNGIANIIKNEVIYVGHAPRYFIHCSTCGLSTKVGSKKEVIKLWNTRPLPEGVAVGVGENS